MLHFELDGALVFGNNLTAALRGGEVLLPLPLLVRIDGGPPPTAALKSWTGDSDRDLLRLFTASFTELALTLPFTGRSSAPNFSNVVEETVHEGDILVSGDKRSIVFFVATSGSSVSLFFNSACRNKYDHKTEQ